MLTGLDYTNFIDTFKWFYSMKKIFILVFLVASCLAYLSFSGDYEKPFKLPPNPQPGGNAAIGYQYLVTGDYLKSGIPYNLFKLTVGNKKENYLGRTGDNEFVNYDFTALTAPNGEKIVAPNCLSCHGQVFDGELYVGLGNTFIDFSVGAAAPKMASFLLDRIISVDHDKYLAAKNFLQGTKALNGQLTTKVRGVNAADRLAGVLVSHRDPVTFAWSDQPLMEIGSEVIPTDVPAWWLLKKKNAMFYNGFGRGDFAKFLMASNLLTVTDTAEAREVYSHFNDVLAFLYTLQPPKYPKQINDQLAQTGKALFEDNCSKCHGTYGKDVFYPNLLIPESTIKTDSALFKANYSKPEMVNWFNNSWFTKGTNPAKLVPYEGYIAPPLDGVWITAPYLHNGSVPTLEALLNSKARPAYWTRDFKTPEYDYEKIGWKYTAEDKPKKKAYNTTIKGYGNYGHYFGDDLTNNERKAVIEYLKTL